MIWKVQCMHVVGRLSSCSRQALSALFEWQHPLMMYVINYTCPSCICTCFTGDTQDAADQVFWVSTHQLLLDGHSNGRCIGVALCIVESRIVVCLHNKDRIRDIVGLRFKWSNKSSMQTCYGRRCVMWGEQLCTVGYLPVSCVSPEQDSGALPGLTLWASKAFLTRGIRKSDSCTACPIPFRTPIVS